MDGKPGSIDKPEEQISRHSKPPNQPKTGDATSILFYYIGSAILGFVLGLELRKGQKNNGNGYLASIDFCQQGRYQIK